MPGARPGMLSAIRAQRWHDDDAESGKREAYWDEESLVLGGNLEIKGPRPWIDVKAKGAMGDGVADDTVPINAAISALPSGGGVVYFPEGTYLISTALTIPAAKHIRLVGAGRDLTILKASGSSAALIAWTQSHLRTEWFSEISHLTLHGNDKDTGTCLTLNNMSKLVLKHLYVKNVDLTGVSMTSLWDGTFIDVFVENCGDSSNPAWKIASDADSSMNNCGFYDCHVENGALHDAVCVQINGDGSARYTTGMKFFGLKCHGDTTNKVYPARPLIQTAALTAGCQWFGGEVSWGSGTSQFELGGQRHLCEHQQFGDNSTNPQECAYDIVGSRNVVLFPSLGADSRTVAIFRLSGNYNKVEAQGLPDPATAMFSDSGTGNDLVGGRNQGATASVADGGTVTHGMDQTPRIVRATGSVAGEMVAVTAISATTFTVAIKTHAGAAGTTQTIYWKAVA